MQLSCFLLVLVASVKAFPAFQLPWNLPPNYKYKPEWDGLRVKWGLNIFSESNFQKLPRRESEAIDRRFELVHDECKEIENTRAEGRKHDAKFAGRRYWKNRDPSLILIYDVNGYIAGIQTAIPKRVIEKDAETKKVMQDQIKETFLRENKETIDSEEEEDHLHRFRRQVAPPSTQASQTNPLGTMMQSTQLGTEIPVGSLSMNSSGQPLPNDQGTAIPFTQPQDIPSTQRQDIFSTQAPERPSSRASVVHSTQGPGTTSTLSPERRATLPFSPALTTRHSTHPPSSSAMHSSISPRVSTVRRQSVSFSPSPSRPPITSTARPSPTTIHPGITPRTTEHPENNENQVQMRPMQFPYVEDHEHVFFTVYFIKPERICKRESAWTVDEMEHFGTGTGIYIQNGTGVQSVFTVPRDEAKLREGRFWKPEKCFWTQGKIYSYNFHDDQDCQAQFPLLLNYNKGRLTGFELLWKLDFSSPYLEHPDKGLLKYMFEKVPKCYREMGRLTKLQIYLTDHYLSHRC